MGRIYKEDRSVIIEGTGEFTPSSLVKNNIGEHITFYSKSKLKNVYDSRWQIIRDKNNDSFNTVEDVTNYLISLLSYDNNDFLLFEELPELP